MLKYLVSSCIIAMATILVADVYVSSSGVYDGNEAYTDLQAAINAASANSTVWIDDGFRCDTGMTEDGNGKSRIVITKKLALRSRSGSLDNSNPPVIVGVRDPETEDGIGSNAVRCVFNSTYGTTLTGIKLEGGATAAVNMNAGYGGGLYSTAICTLSNCFVTGCAAYSGGGCYGLQTLNIVGTVVQNCNALNEAGGVYNVNCQSSSLLDNFSAIHNGAIRSGVIFTNCVIAGNHAVNNNGVGTTGAVFYDCVITNNSAGENCGGVSYYPVLHNCLIGWNYAGKNSGGVAGSSKTAPAQCFDCNFVGNVAGGNGGGGSMLIASNCTFEANFSSGNGGGVFNSVLNDCVVIGNAVSNVLYNTCCGGGVCDCFLTNCLVSGNATLESNGIGIGRGGGARNSVLVDCTVVSNTAASDGGGAYCGVAERTYFAFNNAVAGGAVRECPLIDCTVVSNTAVKDAGGASAASSVRTKFIGNKAGLNGGAVNTWLKNTSCDDCDFINNVAYSGGGAADVIARKCRFIGNLAVDGLGGGANNCVLEMCEVVSNAVIRVASTKYGSVLGGGINDSIATNCFLACNDAINDGTFSFGYAYGGGACNSTVVGCIVSNNACSGRGGGLYGGIGINNIVVGNASRDNQGGGVHGGVYYNCLIIGNSSKDGGAVGYKTLVHNCTVVGNLCTGMSSCHLINTIVADNVGGDGTVEWATNSCGLVCTEAKGSGNKTTNTPKLGVAGRYQYVPMAGSPCLNSGLAEDWMMNEDEVGSHDIYGRRRIIGSKPDIGAFEANVWGSTFFIR